MVRSLTSIRTSMGGSFTGIISRSPSDTFRILSFPQKIRCSHLKHPQNQHLKYASPKLWLDSGQCWRIPSRFIMFHPKLAHWQPKRVLRLLAPQLQVTASLQLLDLLRVQFTPTCEAFRDLSNCSACRWHLVAENPGILSNEYGENMGKSSD